MFNKPITLLYYCNIILKKASGFTALSTTPQYYPGPSKTAGIEREIRASSKNIQGMSGPRVPP